MEWLSGPAASPDFPPARKKRSNFHRRPNPDPKPIINYQNAFRFLSSPADHGGHGEIDSYYSNANSRMEPDFESCSLPSASHIRCENYQDGLKEALHESSHVGNEKKLKKVKLKLGGVTHTLHSKAGKSASDVGGKPATDASGAQHKQDFSRKGASDAKENSSRRAMHQDGAAMDENYNYELIHKSKRALKKRATDEGFDDEDDEEIRYLKKLRASKLSYDERQEEISRKTKGIAKLIGLGHSDAKDCASGFGTDGKKKPRMYEDNDYVLELASDDELKSKKKRYTEGLNDPLMGSGQEMTMTTRKRALECPEFGGLVEYPNGLPPAPSKKQKLTEVEQQLRKAEVAQRRKLQAEKAAKQAEAEAIRKILGQDSSRKKKEDKLKKQQEELAQEKTARAAAVGPNTIRWIMGPGGTVVTFSEDIGLPKIFDSRPYIYPPPREKCVGPNCTNEYKYRDSKSKLPLCSLHCYKAVQGNTGLLHAC